jgi:mutS2 protein
MAGLKECRIIHGKGTGKLRQGIHQFLKNLRYVENFYTAGFSDGNIGATIVKLKSKK